MHSTHIRDYFGSDSTEHSNYSGSQWLDVSHLRPEPLADVRKLQQAVD